MVRKKLVQHIREQLTNFIEIERIIAGNGAVQSCFQERRPPIVQRVRSAFVVFTHPADARVNCFSTVHVLDGNFPEEKQHVAVVLHGTYESRLIKLFTIVLFGSLRFPVDQRIGTGKVSHRS